MGKKAILVVDDEPDFLNMIKGHKRSGKVEEKIYGQEEDTLSR